MHSPWQATATSIHPSFSRRTGTRQWGGGVGEADTGGALTLTCQTASFGAQHAADSGVHEDARGSVHHGALM
jgi:hypothetical protein